MDLIIIFIILFFLWFLRTIRSTLFNVWLWQIKEYRLDRMRAHFATLSGRKLFLNWLNIFKLALLFFLFLSPFVFLWLIIALFALESFLGMGEILSKRFYRPKFTSKALLILSLALGIEFFAVSFFIYNNYALLGTFPILFLILSITLPVIVFLLVLIFKPITKFFKARTVAKAKKKIKKFPNLIVIGITGSYGKTSTKEFLATILSQKFKVLKTVKANTDIGVAKTVLKKLKLEHQIFVVEMGAYRRGEIKAICDIVKPKIGILTGINEQHLALFGSLENTARAKFELIESLPVNGLAVLNGDLRKFKNLAFVPKGTSASKQKSKVSAFGGSAVDGKSVVKNFKFFSINQKIPLTPFTKEGNQNDIFASDIKIERDKIKFKVITTPSISPFIMGRYPFSFSPLPRGRLRGGSENFEINLSGKQNISNILACVGVAEYLGMTLKEISEAVKKIRPIEKTMKVYHVGTGFKPVPTLIDDTYNANPAGVLAALDYLKEFSGRKIILFPGIIELGSAAKKIHQMLGKKMAEVCDLVIITKKDFADYITPSFSPLPRGRLRGGSSSPKLGGVREGTKFIIQENPEKVYQILKNYLKPGDVVLFESRGMEGVLERLKR